METIYLCVEKPHTGYKRASLGNVWKNREPQANSWLTTRKCALKRRDLAIEDGIITWWVASGLGETLTLKLSLTLQSLPGRGGTEANPLGWSCGWVWFSPGVHCRCPVFGGRLWFVPGCFPVAPRLGLSGGWLLSDMSSGTRTWEILQIHLCGTQGCAALAVLLWQGCHCLSQHRPGWRGEISCELIHNRCRSQFWNPSRRKLPHPGPFIWGHWWHEEGTERGSVWVPASPEH